MMPQSTADLGVVRAAVSEALNRLGARLIQHVSEVQNGGATTASDGESSELQARVARLGQLAAGLAVVDAECLPPSGAGYGSVVAVKNVATGAREEYMLMVGSLVDIDANQVSLASPIGQALLGKEAGDEIMITTPTRQSRLLVTNVVTLMEGLEADELHATSK